MVKGPLMRGGMLAAALALTSCSLNHRRSLPQEKMSELWQEPTDWETRDVLHGAAPENLAPDISKPFRIKEVKLTGTQPGYDVVDEQGNEWSVKLGVEPRVEVAMSRLMWAVGYHQPANYYVTSWKMTDGKKDTTFAASRFRLEKKGEKKVGEWSWRHNPFLGTRPMAGLFVMMVIINNWDLKTAQNPIYEVKGDGSPRHVYMVRDLGSSLGKTAWIRLATKDDPADFEEEPFIEGVEDNRVRFHYQGGWMESQLWNSIAPVDVRWTCGLLAKLSDKQLMDAFRAGGFSDAEGARYVKRLKEKIQEGLHVK